MNSVLLIEFSHLYAAKYIFESTQRRPCVLYVHGGPGSNCADFEQALRDLSAFKSSQFDWIVYDQRGCGRSKVQKIVSHEDNIADLAMLCQAIPNLVGIFGHSYGARLAFDTLIEHPEIKLKLIMAGRAIQPEDSMNMSALMDLYILRESDSLSYQKAYEIAALCEGNVSQVGRQIRDLIADPLYRQQKRQPYYWGNLQAMEWWKAVTHKDGIIDNDEVFFSVSDSIRNRTPRTKNYDPSQLTQSAKVIFGFWDFMMAGATKPFIDDKYTVKFNGSGHYPHIEEPQKFLSVLNDFFI